MKSGACVGRGGDTGEGDTLASKIWLSTFSALEPAVWPLRSSTNAVRSRYVSEGNVPAAAGGICRTAIQSALTGLAPHLPRNEAPVRGGAVSLTRSVPWHSAHALAYDFAPRCACS